MKKLRFFCVKSLLFLSASTTVYATTGEIARPWVWSFGLTNQYQNLSNTSMDGIIEGRSSIMRFGAGYVHRKSLQFLNLDIHVGPFHAEQSDVAAIDFSGTGMTYQFGYTFADQGMRGPTGSYGVSVGLAYFDVVGRSIGKSQQQIAQSRNPSDRQDQNFTFNRNHVIHVSGFMITTGLFYSDLKTARPSGNTPELLSTRFEGFIATLGWAFPVYSTHNSTYERVTTSGDVSPVSERDSLQGGALMMTITGLLGA